MALLTCSDVTFSYQGIPVLTDVNFALEAGSYLCIVGENGSGKSTLVKGLLHLKNPSTGSITTGDGLHPSEIGYLPQQTAAQKDFPASVWEVVLSGRQNHPHFPPFYTKADKEDALRNMELLDLLPLKKRCYRDLSGGQQQRVLLARALCATKKLLLLDEPVTGLDPVMTNEMYQLIRRINREQNSKPYHHKCAVCGRTDADHPELEFRYCSRCAGYHCFCQDHINNHIHFTE